MTESLWDEPTETISAEGRKRGEAYAVAAVEGFSSYVLAATSEADLDNRLAMLEQPIEASVLDAAGDRSFVAHALSHLRTTWAATSLRRFLAAGWIDQARGVAESNGFRTVRPDTGEETKTTWKSNGEIGPSGGGVIMDIITANLLVQVHDALSPENAAKFAAMPLEKAVDIAWKMTKRSSKIASGEYNISEHCLPGGDGICDGGLCDCECHGDGGDYLEGVPPLPNNVSGMKAWHDALYKAQDDYDPYNKGEVFQGYGYHVHYDDGRSIWRESMKITGGGKGEDDLGFPEHNMPTPEEMAAEEIRRMLDGDGKKKGSFENPTANSEKIQDFQGEAMESLNANGFSGNDDPKRAQVIDLVEKKIRDAGLTITQEDLDCLEDNNAHAGGEAAERVMKSARKTAAEAPDTGQKCPDCGQHEAHWQSTGEKDEDGEDKSVLVCNNCDYNVDKVEKHSSRTAAVDSVKEGDIVTYQQWDWGMGQPGPTYRARVTWTDGKVVGVDQMEPPYSADRTSLSAIQSIEKQGSKTAAGSISWQGDTHFGVGYVKGRATNGDNYEVYYNPNNGKDTPVHWVNYGPDKDGDTADLNGNYERQGGFATMLDAMRHAEATALGRTASFFHHKDPDRGVGGLSGSEWDNMAAQVRKKREDRLKQERSQPKTAPVHETGGLDASEWDSMHRQTQAFKVSALECTYDSGSMYGNTHKCTNAATQIVTHSAGSGPADESPVCDDHVNAMLGRYPFDSTTVRKISSVNVLALLDEITDDEVMEATALAAEGGLYAPLARVKASKISVWAHENAEHAYNAGASVAERQRQGAYVSTDEMGSSNYPGDWTAGYASQTADILSGGHRFGPAYTGRRQAAHFEGPPNLHGGQESDEFAVQNNVPRTTRPRVLPPQTRDTSFVVPSTAQPESAGMDFSAPTFDQQVAAKVAKIAHQVIEDNPHLTMEAARQVALTALSKHTGVVAGG